MRDKGAHYYRCDFQVHTPRDLNWKGARPKSTVERRTYAADFVRACRERHLDAVAITDHHDMEFVDYIREAAQDERGSDGNALPKEAQLVVFPGMELTLSVPCQAIIIFDAELPKDMFSLAFNSLAIRPNDPDEEVTAPTKRLDLDLRSLHKTLDKHEFLQGRYTVLPNVSEGGTSTLLRSGHANHYRQMRCVGGYLDGNWDQLGEGNLGILTGRNAEYGHKTLGVFQTSDNRRADFTNLGEASTWVKWAEGTAEALRQACLARESRITQSSPHLPMAWITSIEVSNSSFMGPFVLAFNQQYNAIIGGRGTGKSTILEYLRWALCDDPEPGELPRYQERRRDLIENTLKPHSGSVRVTFVVNGVPHLVRRDADSGQVRLKIGADDFVESNPEEVRRLLPLQAYSQKQLSNIAVRLEELERFLHAPIRNELNLYDEQFDEIAAKIREAYLRVQQQRQLRKDLESKSREAQSLKAQAEHLRGGLSGLDDDDREVLTSLGNYNEEQEIVSTWNREIQETKESVTDLLNGLPTTDEANLDGLPNTDILLQLQQAHTNLFTQLGAKLTQASELLDNVSREEGDSEYSSLSGCLTVLHTDFDNRYKAAKAKSSEQEEQLQELESKEQKLTLLRRELDEKQTQLDHLGSPGDEFARLRETWYSKLRERAALVRAQCDSLTGLSNGQIRATLRPAALLEPSREALAVAFAGANILSSKVDTLLRGIEESADPLIELDETLNELERLAIGADQPGYRPVTPQLEKAGFKEGELDRIAQKLNAELWVEVLLVPVGDRPIFEFRVREDEYIAFSDASAGQQATALLWTLLSQDGPPLLIDQPEDDLDNPIIAEIVEHIWDAKQRRQLLFASHNANIVVNGDAELVVACANRITDDQSGGTINAEGAIDMYHVREVITQVMEGGEQAFLLRRDKYGF